MDTTAVADLHRASKLLLLLGTHFAPQHEQGHHLAFQLDLERGWLVSPQVQGVRWALDFAQGKLHIMEGPKDAPIDLTCSGKKVLEAMATHLDGRGWNLQLEEAFTEDLILQAEPSERSRLQQMLVEAQQAMSHVRSHHDAPILFWPEQGWFGGRRPTQAHRDEVGKARPSHHYGMQLRIDGSIEWRLDTAQGSRTRAPDEPLDAFLAHLAA